LTFDYLGNPDKSSDTQFYNIKASFLSGTPFQWYAADGLHSTAGTAGWLFTGEVFAMDASQDAGALVRYQFRVEPTRVVNTAGNLMTPTWYEVSA